MPDWAFRHVGESCESNVRDRISISLRGDRVEQSEDWVRAVLALRDRTGLILHVVSQVKEDCLPAEKLAKTLGAELTVWDNGGHASQEQVVRAVYARSRLAISDRLHVLIMAATEGAAPLAHVDTPISKVSRHLDHLGFSWVAPGADGVGDTLAKVDIETIDAWVTETGRICVEARTRLDAVCRELSALASGSV